MKRGLVIFILGIFLISYVSAVSILPGLPETWGAQTSAGFYRSGNPTPTIYIVNTLSDANTAPTDSTRNGIPVKQGPLLGILHYIETRPASEKHIVLFEVSGTIHFDPAYFDYFNLDNVAVMGQSAPAPGITIAGTHIRLGTVSDPGSNQLWQHIRFRVGDKFAGDAGYWRALSMAGPSNIVIDHCSFSWGIDINLGLNGDGIIASNNIITEGLDESFHPKTIDPNDPGYTGQGHSKGCSAATENDGKVIYYKNYMSHNKDRNPLIGSGPRAAVNNLIYNYGEFPIMVRDYRYLTDVNLVNNFVKAGPSTCSNTCENFATIWEECDATTDFYFSGNRFISKSGASYTQASPSDWSIVRDHGGCEAATKVTTRIANAWPTGLEVLPVNEVPGILNNVGAWPASRDSVDVRVVNDYSAGTGRIIDSQNDVGGWPNLAENHITLSIPSNPHGDSDSDGYTNIEEWLQTLACQAEGSQSPSCSGTSTPICNEGQITSLCLCGGTEHSSGYCCSGAWQSGSCSGQLNSYTILRVNSPPVIDGDLNEFNGANEITLSNSRGNSATYRFLWDDNALYISAEGSDSQLAAINTIRDGDLYTDDSIELFFDTLNNGGASLNSDDYKFYVNILNAQSDYYNAGGGRNWDTTFSSIVITDGTVNSGGDTDIGYTIEAAIPWTDWVTPSANNVWGFDVNMNDRNDAGAREWNAWNQETNLNIPNDFGEMIFSSQAIAGSSSCSSGADTSGDNAVSITELLNFISLWKNSGTITISELLSGISEWKNGC